ncbi:hypothetical protein QR680_005875 [Steinernema hermaphroditum]|uniref:RNA helicase n=1 Tax=Steinernema hermaphroditum TaxID=289476 RepID=A0AA39LWG0_9BILA|nr:hypothetical protein QR680_005875 [Steinernema hermaphroditum]
MPPEPEEISKAFEQLTVNGRDGAGPSGLQPSGDSAKKKNFLKNKKKYERRKLKKKKAREDRFVAEEIRRLHNYQTGNIVEQRKALPITAYRQRILREIRAHQVVVVKGETGSGKSTQLPQFILEEGLHGGKMIVCTQPRRIAARVLSERVAEEKKCQVGNQVGYRIRFDHRCSDKTKILYATEGMILREMCYDFQLSKYSFVILDEAHERSLPMEELLCQMKYLLSVRKDLKVIVCSATMDSERFAAFFNTTSILEIPGRSFKVDVFYDQYSNYKPNEDRTEGIVKKITDIVRSNEPGDILVFESGEDNIENVCAALNKNYLRVRKRAYNRIDEDESEESSEDESTEGSEEEEKEEDSLQELLEFATGTIIPIPLFGLEQISPHGDFQVVIATNIAETSLTIDGIRFVIDSGFVKQMYEKTGLNSTGFKELREVRISKAEAEQRRGRAGRTAPGKCFRLYSEHMFKKMDEMTKPAYLLTNLNSFFLNLSRHKFFPKIEFIEPPKKKRVVVTLVDLFHHGAIDNKGSITAKGNTLLEFPLSVEHADLIYTAVKPEYKCAQEMVAAIALLNAPPIFIAGGDKHFLASRMKEYGGQGDFVFYAILFLKFMYCKRDKMEWCLQRKIDFDAMNTALRIYNQLSWIVTTRLNANMSSCGTRYERMIKAFLQVNYRNVAVMDNRVKSVDRYCALLPILVDADGQKKVSALRLSYSSVVKRESRLVVFDKLAYHKTGKNYAIEQALSVEEEWIKMASRSQYTIVKEGNDGEEEGGRAKKLSYSKTAGCALAEKGIEMFVTSTFPQYQ